MAAAPSYLVDTNILLRLSKKDDPNYLLVQAAIEALVMEGSELCFTPQNLIEFWNVCTRPASHNGFGLSVSETDRLARAIEGTMTLLQDNENIYPEWRRLVMRKPWPRRAMILSAISYWSRCGCQCGSIRRRACSS